ncbi:MAG TPA: peptidoglycan-binding protein [Gammaproteobacteria bacterium]|nr:peptidoglycan-binding protein [Gammaproteobacteria bacterium]
MTQHIYNGVGFNGFKLDSSLTARSSAASLKTTMRHLMSKLGLHATLFALLLSLVCWTQLAWSQDAPILAADYPDRYTVIDGDTLWGISSRFLRDPWRWPEVWQGNPQVENPDLIYPGDVLLMSFIDGKATVRSLRREVVKLLPTARAEDYSEAIPPIDPAAIQAYLNAPLVTDEEELLKAAYIVEGFDSRLLLGRYNKFYARGITDLEAKEYRVFRPGRHFKDPVTGESLGFEAKHLGDAKMLTVSDPSKLIITKSLEDITIRDRLRPVRVKEALPFFYPSAPLDSSVTGVILETPNRSTELGALSVIAINLGEREQMRPGDVLRIFSHSRTRDDPMTGEEYSTPEERVGLALIFRTFAKVSYAIITDSERQVLPGDILRSPEYEKPLVSALGASE